MRREPDGSRATPARVSAVRPGPTGGGALQDTAGEPLPGDGPARIDLLDVLASGEPPAFATTEERRISFWNAGATRVLGLGADSALGRHCDEILQGRDLYGNLFCYESCPVLTTARGGESPRPCEIIVPVPDGRRTFVLTTLRVAGSRPDTFTLVHVLEAVTSADRLAPLVEPLGMGGDGAARPETRCCSTGPAAGHGHADGRAPRAPGDGGGESPPLTVRESEILYLVASGLQNKEIATRLGISLATVRNHVHSMLEKLGVHSKLEAVCLAFRAGWVGPSTTVPRGIPAAQR